jgi:hypothetical protein
MIAFSFNWVHSLMEFIAVINLRNIKKNSKNINLKMNNTNCNLGNCNIREFKKLF